MSSLTCDIPPEFSTYNIFRSYMLRVQLYLKHGKRSIIVSEQNIPVTLTAGQGPEPPNAYSARDHYEFRSSEGQAFLPCSGTDELDGPPPGYVR